MFKISPNKNKDHSFLLKFLFCFLWCSAAIALMYSFAAVRGGSGVFSLKGAFILWLCCIPLSVLYAVFIERFGSFFGNLFTGWSGAEVPPEEQFSADLAKARYSKGRGEFKEALIIINNVLKLNPKFPEALLLKAQIVWEGFANKELARRNLDKVMELVEDDDPIHRWAMNYYHDIGKNKE